MPRGRAMGKGQEGLLREGRSAEPVAGAHCALRAGVAILQRSIRLYAPFYSSDILIASPLGLRTIIGGEGEKKRDFDFLSSIELLIIDQADIYLMQNWEHVLVILVIHMQRNKKCPGLVWKGSKSKLEFILDWKPK